MRRNLKYILAGGIFNVIVSIGIMVLVLCMGGIMYNVLSNEILVIIICSLIALILIVGYVCIVELRFMDKAGTDKMQKLVNDENKTKCDMRVKSNNRWYFLVPAVISTVIVACYLIYCEGNTNRAPGTEVAVYSGMVGYVVVLYAMYIVSEVLTKCTDK